jgi:electron transfer flavoprotein beta subunit
VEDIMVCVKQVPRNASIRMDLETHTLVRDGVESVMNPQDAVALSAALELKAEYGIKIGVVSMGPKSAAETVSECLAMGADEGFLITDGCFAGSDTLATAISLAVFIRKSGYRTVFCGNETTDSATGQVGPSIAQMTGLACVTNVERILQFKEGAARAIVKSERARKEFLVDLPAVFAFIGHGGTADHGARAGKRKKRRAAGITRLDAGSLGIDKEGVGLKGSPTKVVSIEIDESSVGYINVTDGMTPEEKIACLLRGGLELRDDGRRIRDLDGEEIAEVAAMIRGYR